MAHTQHIQAGEIAKPNTAKIWRVFWILLGITAIEFVFAFAMGAGALRTTIFAILTVVKAAYIVGEFMHLAHEVKFLIWAIILPMMFIVWLLLAMIWEGGSVFNLHDSAKKKEKASVLMYQDTTLKS